ncbi:hypothetical protein MOC17_20735 [Bacillus haynesii]|uniref:deoxynucleotide monophosphate kinase family protein n=1 Tax=Bacillus haynesii TaxID=1925021 RepID=UPI00228117AA|nr:hypothetical protein [Bacillus haynesii]MCY8048483.1 hypothetical protein [Bacillus haynesii]MCY9324040.1 hypothetical protein [Bacillus haynesii]
MKIALVGKMRSGKDTVGRFFSDNRECYPIAFGDGISRIGYMFFPELMLGGKPRKLKQTIGQVFRQFDPDVWVKTLSATMTNLSDSGIKNFVVTDVRQMNEYNFLKEQGFTVIKVEAADELRLERIKASGDEFTEEDLNHETELAVDDIPFDYLITNNTTIEDLYTQLRFIVGEIEEEQR